MSDQLQSPERATPLRGLWLGTGAAILALGGVAMWQFGGLARIEDYAAAMTATADPKGDVTKGVAELSTARATPAAAEAPVMAAATVKPTFDIVRVGPEGNAVLAGRAAPNAEVRVADNGAEVGRVTADATGSWVMTPALPVGKSGRELSVAARAPSGEVASGEAPVMIVVPELPPVSRPAAGGLLPASSAAAPLIVAANQMPLVVKMPANGPTQVLQTPFESVSGPGGVRAGALGLNAVDYDEHGQIRFSGSAPAGTTVRGYIDNKAAGEAVADARGQWLIVPPGAVGSGDHRVRLDQMARSGKVAGRIELPFERVAVSPAEVAAGKLVSHMVVQPRQTLWWIARRTYGQGVRYTVIYEANKDQIRDPNLIYPGQIFAIPAKDAARAPDSPMGGDGGGASPASSTASR